MARAHFYARTAAELAQIEGDGLRKPERVIVSPQGATVTVGGRPLVNMCTNDYLGLANDPRVVEGAVAATRSHGAGLASVRFICGTQDLHKQLEAAIADYLGFDDAILVAAAFDANGSVFETRLGADLSIMSLTKYVGGHSDVIGGSVSASLEWLAPVKVMRTILGTMPDPHTCWLLMRSLETLHLRMRECAATAKKVAAFLSEHPNVRNVWFLDVLPAGHPDRAVYEKQCLSAGSTFSFEVKGGEAEAFRVPNALQHIKLAVSLGGTGTLASHPSSMTHSDFAAEEKVRLGISDALIRIAVGVEDASDLIADLEQALDHISV